MTQFQFTKATRKHGLYHPQMGLDAHKSLSALAKEPQPLQPTRFRSKLRGAPSAIPQMGVLVRCQFARLDRELEIPAYVITDKGLQWLSDVQELIFNQPALQTS